MSPTSPMSPTTKALRIQTLKLKQTFAIPWYSGAIAILLVAAIFAIADDTPYSGRTTGALSAFYLSGFGMQPWLVNQLFPFSMALSVTRGAFVRATMLVVAAETVATGIGLTILDRLETATHGWFVHARVVDLPHVHQDNVLTQALVYGIPMTALSAISAFIGAVFRAFGQFGLWVFAVGMAFLAAAVIVVLTLTHTGSDVVHFFSTQPMLADFALYPLALVALFGTGWAVLMMRARV